MAVTKAHIKASRKYERNNPDRTGYNTLIKLLLATVDRLQSLDVGVRVVIGDDVGYTYKTSETDKAA